MTIDNERSSPQPRPRQAKALCPNCGQVAAEFVLAPGGAAPRDALFGDRDRLIRSGFMGKVTLMPSPEHSLRLFETLLAGDLRSARRLDPDALGFYCPDCDAPYSEACWTLGPPIFDEEFEGFYDRTEASCPRGHRHVVDD